MKQRILRWTAVSALATVALAGCGTYGDKNSSLKNGPVAEADKAYAPNTTSQAAYVIRTSYDTATKQATLHVALYGTPGRRLAQMTAPSQLHTGETVIDLSQSTGIIDYAFSKYPNACIRTVKIMRIDQKTSTPAQVIQVPSDLQDVHTLQTTGTTGDFAAAASHVATPGAIQLPPPGCKVDRTIQAIARANSPRSTKADAVMSVAKSKLGAPYIWGHNEDRGQLGFDCSNFTEYVYRHALGYKMTTSSRGQNNSVGVPVPAASKQVGDLLIFENGKHVGIYAGNNKVIQDGGGLGKVGYLSLASGSYWGNHLTSVRRMF